MTHNIDGINCHLPDNTDGIHMKDCKFQWARIGLNWFDIEKKPGVYNWSKADAGINNCVNNGIKIYATLAYTPSIDGVNAIPDAAQYGEFCRLAARRYGAKIAVYSLWNEPNLKEWFIGNKDEYIWSILIPGYTAIKTVNPALVVAACDLSTIERGEWTKWIDKLAGFTQYFDIFTVHAYSDDLVKDFNRGSWWLMQWLFPSKRSYWSYLKKIDKPIWLTETGWDTKSRSEDQQAQEIENLSNQKSKLKVERIFLYVLNDYLAAEEVPFGIYKYIKIPKRAVDFLSQ
jgi:hypothetical protein